MDGYPPEPAQKKTQEPRTLATKYKIPALTVKYAECQLSLHWNPEQISGVGHLIGMPISHEWIYRYIAANKVAESFTKRYGKDINAIDEA